MSKYVCPTCEWVYDPEEGDPVWGIDPGTPFDQVDDHWVCPSCTAPKEDFKLVEE